ncbi:MAG TPA: ClpXP protease specificity-enhancing factor [Azospira sp.]|nr:ClpXP protease specificity-enhancing factor [Azospira sp.]
MQLPSTKPYLIRAIYEWCVDNGFTPYIAVAVDERTLVPREYVRDGQIVLNISGDATSHLNLSNDLISFAARFGGVARDLSVPVSNVVAIYARENGAGMAFEVDEEEAEIDADAPVAEADENPPEPPATPPSGRPHLQRVK